MTEIIITMMVDAESADPDDPTGLTEEAFEEIHAALGSHGHDIDIRML